MGKKICWLPSRLPISFQATLLLFLSFPCLNFAPNGNFSSLPAAFRVSVQHGRFDGVANNISSQDAKQHPRMTQDQPFPLSEPGLSELHLVLPLTTNSSPAQPAEVDFELGFVLL